MMTGCDDQGRPTLGPCCNCGRADDNVVNIMMVKQRGPTPGKGWGCVVCGLPSDGALVVLCDDCGDVWPPTFVCTGYPASDGRTPFADLSPEPFDHDPAKHREELKMDIRNSLIGNPTHRKALMHVRAAGGSMTEAAFDEANHPHGALLRRDLAPSLLRLEHGHVYLTDEASKALED